jgi:hypothetical protein
VSSRVFSHIEPELGHPLHLSVLSCWPWVFRTCGQSIVILRGESQTCCERTGCAAVKCSNHADPYMTFIDPI